MIQWKTFEATFRLSFILFSQITFTLIEIVYKQSCIAFLDHVGKTKWRVVYFSTQKMSNKISRSPHVLHGKQLQPTAAFRG